MHLRLWFRLLILVGVGWGLNETDPSMEDTGPQLAVNWTLKIDSSEDFLTSFEIENVSNSTDPVETSDEIYYPGAKLVEGPFRNFMVTLELLGECEMCTESGRARTIDIVGIKVEGSS